MTKNTKTFYGKIILFRAECPECGHMAIVDSGKSTCCGAKIAKVAVDKVERVTRGSSERKQLPQSKKDWILKHQQNKCCYCDCDLEDTWYISRRMKFPRKVKTEFDHVMPHSYASNGDITNFVACCNICNTIKRDFMLDTVENIRSHIARRKPQLGYEML